MKDFYYILGIDTNCTPDEIKEAYRKLSKKFHPDLNQNDKYFESRFRDIQEAYETLINSARRRQYDAVLNQSKYGFTDNSWYAKKQYPTRNKGIDVAFTIILILITLMFGDYVIKSITGSKAVKTDKTPVVSYISLKSPLHRKKKHLLKAVIINHPPKVGSKNYSTVNIPAHISPEPVTDTPKKIPFKAAQVIYKDVDNPPPSNDNNLTDNTPLSYTSYIRSNITGVVNMRKFEGLNSEIVNVIPTNSKVLVLGKGKTYYKVQFNNAVGYVPKWTIKTK